MRYVIPLLATGLLFLNGCSLNKFTANTTAGLLGEGSTVFNEEVDLGLARDSMPANLKMMEALLKASPDNDTMLTMLAQGYCSYAFAFLEDSDNPNDLERAKALYQRGFTYGMRALPKKVRETSKTSLADFEKAVSDVDKDQVPQLFWTAYCLGNWVNLKKADIAAVAELPRVEIMMRRVLDQDETFYNGGVHLFYGVYYGSRPKMLGGNPQKAKEHFQKALRMSDGKFLMPKLFMAQFYAIPTQDEALFKSSLEEVLKAPADLMPSERLANQVAKRRAEKLLAAQKDYF